MTNDVDVICREGAWSSVRKIGRVEYLAAYDVTIVTMADGALTFGTKWGIGDFDVDHLISTADIIDDLPFVALEHVVAYKRTRLSEKDRRHLTRWRVGTKPSRKTTALQQGSHQPITRIRAATNRCLALRILPISRADGRC